MLLTEPIAESRKGVQDQVIACAGLLVATIIWGVSFPIAKDLLSDVPIFTYLTLRFALSVTIVAFLFARPLRQWWTNLRSSTGIKRGAIAAHLLPGLCLAGAYAAQARGLQLSAPSSAAFLTSLIFCFVPMFEYVFGARRDLGSILPPLILAFAGVVLLTRPQAPYVGIGPLLLVLAAASYAAQIYFTGRVAPNVHVAIPFVIQGTVVTAVSALCAVGAREQLPAHLSIPISFRFLYLVFVATILCFLLQFWAQRHIRAPYVGLLYTMEPVSAFAVSVAFGYETMRIWSAAGSVLILAAVSVAIVLAVRPSN